MEAAVGDEVGVYYAVEAVMCAERTTSVVMAWVERVLNGESGEFEDVG